MAWGSQRLLPREGLIVGQGVGRNKPFEYGVKVEKSMACLGERVLPACGREGWNCLSQTEVNIRSYPKHKKESL